MNSKWLFSCLATLLIAPLGYAADEDEELYPEVTPEDCIHVRQIKKTDIVDDQNIIFHLHGGKIYRNRLPRKCFGLKRRESFSYKIHTARLCDIDSIRVVDQFAGRLDSGPSCGLGKFYPISKEEVAFLLGDEPRAELPEAPDDE